MPRGSESNFGIPARRRVQRHFRHCQSSELMLLPSSRSLSSSLASHISNSSQPSIVRVLRRGSPLKAGRCWHLVQSVMCNSTSLGSSSIPQFGNLTPFHPLTNKYSRVEGGFKHSNNSSTSVTNSSSAKNNFKTVSFLPLRLAILASDMEFARCFL
uniref:Uncharacterized protein n=1 Tax=Opuntia streptacantha TaxID=393608 RepID=A0A7C9E0Q6_OPUST